jgi:hypothetical protein
MKKWFSRTTKSTALALIAIGVTVSIAWAAPIWWPSQNNIKIVHVKAPVTHFIDGNNLPGIVMDPGANQDDVIDFGPGYDRIVFGGDTANLFFSAGNPLNGLSTNDAINYVDIYGLLYVVGDNVEFNATAGDLILTTTNSTVVQTNGGDGPNIELDNVSGDVVLQMGPN